MGCFDIFPEPLSCHPILSIIRILFSVWGGILCFLRLSLTELARYYHHRLKENPEALTWLKEKYAISDETIDNLLIGYADNESGVIASLRSGDNGFSKRELAATGAFRPTSQDGLNPFFEKRIIFPYWSRGRVVFMIGRKTPWTSDANWEQGKYKKLPVHDEHQRPYVARFINNAVLFNEDCLLGKPEHIIITEGVTDCIALMQQGFPALSPVTVRIRAADWERLVPKMRGIKTVYICQDNEISEADTIRCDGQVVVSGGSTDSAGRVTGAFTIPANVRNGNRVVEVTDGTYSAETNLQVNDPLVITRIQRIAVNRTIVRRQTIIQRVPPRIVRVPVVRTVWRWRWRFRRRDPLAQTFSFTRNRVVSAVGVYFTQKDATIPVTVQIRGVTTGLPNEVVMAEKVVSPDEITPGMETKIEFDDPFYADANTSYAVVLLTNSTNFRVRIATLGQMGQNGVITRQTYAAGALLESSNAETWTPLNGSDLTMKIYGYDFENNGEIRFQPISGVQFSELNLDEYSSLPEGTAISWEYSADGGSTWDAIVPAEEENLPNLATGIIVRAVFSGTEINDSTALNFKDVNLIGYLNNPTGTYLSRENELTQGVESTKVYAQMHIPSGTSINWFATNDGGITWESMSIETTREIDNEWTEYTLTRTFADNTGTKVRYKAEFTGNNLVYPRVHSLGATLS